MHFPSQSSNSAPAPERRVARDPRYSKSGMCSVSRLIAVAILGVPCYGQRLSPANLESRESESVAERSRPLTDHGLRNMMAFARLLGYVRHFYPGHSAAVADWDAIAVHGVRIVEDAADPATLAAKLDEVFRPVAPLVRVSLVGAFTSDIGYALGPRIISWKHHGFGGATTLGGYYSEHVTIATKGGRIYEPLKADLGAGVAALVPVLLDSFDIGKFDNGTLRRTIKSQPRPGAIQYKAEDRAVRLAGVIIAWNVLQHFYPYFDVVRVDWPNVLEDSLHFAAAGSADDYRLTLRSLVAALKDGHAGVAPGDTGTGSPIAWAWIEERLVVTAIPDAQGQPVAVGDTVLSINGKPVVEVLHQEEALISGATPQWIRHRALTKIGMTVPDKPLILDIEPFHSRSEKRTVTLKGRAGHFLTETRPDKIAELKPGIWYVDLTRVNDGDFAGALEKLAKASGIVFDLRGYPSLSSSWLTHLSPTPMTSAQWHVPVVTAPDRVNMKFERLPGWDLQPTSPYLNAKRAVLTDGRAISYAESTMEVVEYYGLAEIVGSTTAGTNGSINQFQVPGGCTLVFTGMKVLKHDGSQHHTIGIKPTIPVERTRAGVAAGRDEVLAAGIIAVQ